MVDETSSSVNYGRNTYIYIVKQDLNSRNIYFWNIYITWYYADSKYALSWNIECESGQSNISNLSQIPNLFCLKKIPNLLSYLIN